MIGGMKSPILSCAIVLTLSFGALRAANAGSATWNLNPISGDWNTAANWTPNTVPNGPNDTATFGVSQRTGITQPASIGLNGMVFNPGASIYTISLTGTFNISGTGIVNNSGGTQNITCNVASSGDFGVINFTNNATSGESVNYDVKGGPFSDFIGGEIWFYDQSSAGSGVFTANGGSRSGASGSEIVFADESTAAHATFISNGGAVGATGSGIFLGAESSLAESSVVVNGGFYDYGPGIFVYSTTVPLVDVSVTTNGGTGAGAFGGSSQLDSPGAEGCTFTSNGGSASGAGGGTTEFSGTFDTGDSVLIANAGTNGGNGGVLLLLDSALVAGRVELFGNGTLDLSQHDAPGASLGSIEGDGVVDLGALNLTVGSNDLSTTFSGIIQDTGSLTKVGTGTLTLSGANTYTGATTLTAGSLVINNTTGSGTGAGAVQVKAGTVGGKGIIAGAVTVGTGSGTGAFLETSIGVLKTTSLSIQSALTFKADSTYRYNLNTIRAKADKVIANGVTIGNGAQFNFVAAGNKTLAPGKVFVAISNTAATPISGTFANLPDGSTFTIGPNTFQVSYEGGDGNDLTLTVIP
jgi:autotransporter-associated beta strand protein